MLYLKALLRMSASLATSAVLSSCSVPYCSVALKPEGFWWTELWGTGDISAIVLSVVWLGSFGLLVGVVVFWPSWSSDLQDEDDEHKCYMGMANKSTSLCILGQHQDSSRTFASFRGSCYTKLRCVYWEGCQLWRMVITWIKMGQSFFAERFRVWQKACPRRVQKLCSISTPFDGFLGRITRSKVRVLVQTWSLSWGRVSGVVDR